MAIMHPRRHCYLLLHCQRYPGLRRARIPHRCPFRNPDVLPPYGMHVAIRQLERQGPQREVDFLVGVNIFILVGGTFLLVAGTYGAVQGIIDAYATSGGSAAWSCEDNSNSV